MKKVIAISILVSLPAGKTEAFEINTHAFITQKSYERSPLSATIQSKRSDAQFFDFGYLQGPALWAS